MLTKETNTQPPLSNLNQYQGLSCYFTNTHGGRHYLNTIYISNLVTDNTLILTIQNNTANTLSFTPGAPVAVDQLSPQGPSSFFFTFPNFLSAAVIQSINVNATDWRFKFFQEKQFYYIALTPLYKQTLAPNASIQFTFTNVNTSLLKDARADYFVLDYRNITNLVDGEAPQIPIFLNHLPGYQNPLPNLYSFGNSQYPNKFQNEIYVTIPPTPPLIDNTLILTLTNPIPDASLVSSSTPSEFGSPAFNVIFVYSKSPDSSGNINPSPYSALCTQDESPSYSINPIDGTEQYWTCQQLKGGSAIIWQLLPNTTNNSDILSPARPVASFAITKIESTLPVATTPMYIQNVNISGYDDGYQFLTIVKSMAKPTIEQFYIEINGKKVDPNNPATMQVAKGHPITLYWQARAGDSSAYCSLENDGSAPTVNNLPLMQTNGYSVTPTPLKADGTVTYTLVCFGGDSSDIVASFAIVKVTPSLELNLESKITRKRKS